MSGKLSKAIEHLYDERKDFIIIGLTGRTGSGCTTVAHLLSLDFETFSAPKPKSGCSEDNEERKYSIAYNYVKKNWEPFKIIEMRNIITSFILEYDFDDLCNYIKDISTHNSQELIIYLEGNIKNEFNVLHKKRDNIKLQTQENEDYLKEDEVYKFYFEELPEFTQNFKEALNHFYTDTYTELFQAIGNNLRASGIPYSGDFSPQNIFKLSQRTNTLIKVLRKRNIKHKGRVLVVIDAFRNPYEATFFKDRYSAFYLVAINTNDNFRTDRLVKDGLNHQQISHLDKKEYPNKKKGVEIFSHQNIQKCLEISDIFLYNPSTELSDRGTLKKSIIKYIGLMIHPGLITPTHIERTMQLAYNAKLNSGCISRQVGAAVTDCNFSVKSIGWNSTPECQVECNLRSIDDLYHRENIQSYSNYELSNESFRKIVEHKYEKINQHSLNGRAYSYCFKDLYNELIDNKNQVHTRSLHAEENAFLQISKYGGAGVLGGYLFTTASPCELCSKKAYQLGIKKIFYIDPYPGISLDHILNNGSRRPELILYIGAIGRAFTQLYNPIISYKDELELLVDG